MYRSWIRWNNLSDKMTRQMSIDVAENGQFITSFSVSSNIIAIGVHDKGTRGHVAVYDITQLSKGPIHVGHESRETTVRGVQVWRKDNHLKVASYSNSGVAHWNVLPLLDRPKRKVSPPNTTSLISANLGCCYTLAETHGSPNNCCALTIEQLPDLDSQIIHWSKRAIPYIRDMDADGDKVILLSFDPVHRYLTINEISAKSGGSTNITTIDSDSRVFLHSKIFKPCVVVCRDDDTSDIGFSVAGRQLKYYGHERDLKLNSYIRSFYFHIGLLILGLASGEIYIVYVKDADQLENLNFETMGYKILALNNGPIFHVSVTEYNSVHYIVATTSEKLHLVEFY